MRLLVDLSGVAYRAAYKLRQLSGKGRSTGIVYGVLRSLEALLRELEPEELTIAWDQGHEARSRLLPEYKATRKRDPEITQEMERQMPLVRRLLHLLPVTQVAVKGVEADDVIGELCRLMEWEHVGVVTGDKDLYQLARPIGRRSTGQSPSPVRCGVELFNYDGYPVEMEFAPKQYLVYKMLVGDPSDNIKGVDRVGDVTARALLKQHKDLRRIMKAARREGRLGSMAWPDALARVMRNRDLMKLDGRLLTDDQKAEIEQQWVLGLGGLRLDAKGLRRMMQELGFRSTLAKFEYHFAPFKRLERGTSSRQIAGAEDDETSSLIEATGQAGPSGPQGHRKIRRVITTPTRGARRVRRTRVPLGAERRGAVPIAAPAAQGVAAQLDPSRSDPGAARVVPHALRQRGTARTWGQLAELPASEDVLARESSRRDYALSLLPILGDAEQAGWVSHLDTARLRRLKRIVVAFLDDPEHAPISEADLLWLHALVEQYMTELPGWAQ